METTVAQETKPPSFPLDAGVFELPGNGPLWIWAHTCREPRCNCREALIVATDESREALLTHGLPVHEAWETAAGYQDAAAKRDQLTPFLLHIDTAAAFGLDGRPLNLADAHPRIAAIVDRMNGDVLDKMGELWYLGKGFPDQREIVLKSKSLKIPGWHPGDMVYYSAPFKWVRNDFYVLEDEPEIEFEAHDMYCVNPGCPCGDVVVAFVRLEQTIEQSVGMVEVNLCGRIGLKPEAGQKDTLERLWAAYGKRHPACMDRFARRDADMKLVGNKIRALKAEKSAAAVKIGRNDPCSCGSGKKYKKCCGVSHADVNQGT